MSRFYILTTAVLSRTKAKAKAESTNPVVKNAETSFSVPDELPYPSPDLLTIKCGIGANR